MPNSTTPIIIENIEGNPIVLLRILIDKSLITFTDFNTLQDIYNNINLNLITPIDESLLQTALDDFKKLLNTIEVKDEILVILGKISTNRNNYLMLLTLKALRDKGINFAELVDKETMEDLATLESIREADNEKLPDLYLTSRKPKLIDYSLEPGKITLYTKAPIKFEIIKFLADKLNVYYQDDTAVNLARTIDKINTMFAEKIRNKQVHELLRANSNTIYTNMGDQEIADFPILYLMHNVNTSYDLSNGRDSYQIPNTINNVKEKGTIGFGGYNIEYNNEYPHIPQRLNSKYNPKDIEREFNEHQTKSLKDLSSTNKKYMRNSTLIALGMGIGTGLAVALVLIGVLGPLAAIVGGCIALGVSALIYSLADDHKTQPFTIDYTRIIADDISHNNAFAAMQRAPQVPSTGLAIDDSSDGLREQPQQEKPGEDNDSKSAHCKSPLSPYSQSFT